MNRKIKYRVWDNENKSYNDPYSYAYYALTQDGRLDFYCHGDHMGEADPDVYSIEQYTGLKDKHGNEIYEGDIVKCKFIYDKRYKCRGLIIMREDKACYAIKDIFGLTSEEVELYRLTAQRNLEVIGNIHENQDLLGDTNVTNKEEK